MRRLALCSLAALALGASGSRMSRDATYLYTYYDRKGTIVINNLPPSAVKGQGLTLKRVGVGHISLAISSLEMARVVRSPELIALADDISRSVGVDPFLVRAVIQAESAFNYRARSRTGALGLMQLMPKTAERFGVLDPFDPRQNITGGAQYLRFLLTYYKGDTTRAVAAYNAGEGAVDRHKGVPPFRETRAYVPRVLDLYQRRLVQPDTKASGAMALLKRGRGGFKVEEKVLPVAKQLAALQEPEDGNGKFHSSGPIFSWVDASGRSQISDQPPPKGTQGVKVYGVNEPRVGSGL